MDQILEDETLIKDTNIRIILLRYVSDLLKVFLIYDDGESTQIRSEFTSAMHYH